MRSWVRRVGLGAAAGVVAGLAARQPAPPVITVRSPDMTIAPDTSLDVQVETPGGDLRSLDAVLERDGRFVDVFTLPPDAPKVTGTGPAADRLWIIRPLGAAAREARLTDGPATLHVTAVRPAWFGLRTAVQAVSRPVTLSLQPQGPSDGAGSEPGTGTGATAPGR